MCRGVELYPDAREMRCIRRVYESVTRTAFLPIVCTSDVYVDPDDGRVLAKGCNALGWDVVWVSYDVECSDIEKKPVTDSSCKIYVNVRRNRSIRERR
jgi:hypothetical protein